MGEVERFVAAATAFCTWAESDGRADPRGEAYRARQLLAELIAAAIDLPERSSDTDAESISSEEYRRIYRRFASLPFNLYSKVFNPLQVPSEDPVVADLADDLADIWRDLKPGLSLYEAGRLDSAIWEWRLGFVTHWGHHATAVLYALQRWLSQNDDLV